MGNVQIVKLITGEELLAEVIEVEPPEPEVFTGDLPVAKLCSYEPEVILKNPAAIGLNRETRQFGFIPYGIFCANHEIRVRKQNIVWTGKPDGQVENAYSAEFGSGLVIAKQSDMAKLGGLGNA